MQNPYAEIDFKTSGGHDKLQRDDAVAEPRSANGLAMNAQYTLGRSRARQAARTRRTPRQQRADADEFDYDDGYNNFDVRHTFNLSALYALPFGQGRNFGSDAAPLAQTLLGGWESAAS